MILLATFGSWVFDSIQSNSDRDRERDVRVAALANYNTERELYITQAYQHETCLTAIETREALRRRMIGLASMFERFVVIIDTAVDSEEGQAFVEELYVVAGDEIAAIEQDLPPRRVEDCPPVPEPPIPPDLEVVSAFLR